MSAGVSVKVRKDPLEDGEMNDLLITEKLEVLPKSGESSGVKLRVGKVLETLVPQVQLFQQSRQLNSRTVGGCTNRATRDSARG